MPDGFIVHLALAGGNGEVVFSYTLKCSLLRTGLTQKLDSDLTSPDSGLLECLSWLKFVLQNRLPLDKGGLAE